MSLDTHVGTGVAFRTLMGTVNLLRSCLEPESGIKPGNNGRHHVKAKSDAARCREPRAETAFPDAVENADQQANDKSDHTSNRWRGSEPSHFKQGATRFANYTPHTDVSTSPCQSWPGIARLGENVVLDGMSQYYQSWVSLLCNLRYSGVLE